jgi:predicted O-methyltransferase YrrM
MGREIRIDFRMEKPTLDKFPKKVLAQIGIEKAFIVSRLVVAAERLQLFRLLYGKRMDSEAIGRALRIHRFYLVPFLNALVSLGLLRKGAGRYSNAAFTTKYFIKGRPICWTRQYSKECVEAYEMLTVLEEALASGGSYESIRGLKTVSYTEAMKRDRQHAEDFTQMLFHLHQNDAKALANYLDLSRHHAVLDVGGGSGVMSMALAKKNPQLRACILDIAPVCEIAARNIAQAGLSRRVTILAGDMSRRLPVGYDVIMFCDVGNRLSKQLLRNAYKSLPEGGLVVLADRYLSKDGTYPLDRLVEHFVGSSFGLATWADMAELLRSCGFVRVSSRKVHREMWYITGIKPEEKPRRNTRPAQGADGGLAIPSTL